MSHRDEPIDIEDRETLASVEESLRAAPTEAELAVVRTSAKENEHEC